MRLRNLATRPLQPLAAAVICICTGCQNDRALAPLPPCYSSSQPSKVPLIIEGEVIEDSGPARAPEISEWGDEESGVQLWKVKVRVDQVLQGDLEKRYNRNDLTIFYFINNRYVGSASHLLHMYTGDAEIFFLQRDGSALRTVCDGWQTCVFWVRTGTHRNYKLDATAPIEDRITDLLLSEGDHPNTSQMLDAIWHPEFQWGTAPVIEALRRVSRNSKSQSVRELATTSLQSFEKAWGKGTRNATCQ